MRKVLALGREVLGFWSGAVVPSERISFTYTVKMPWPRDERGFIAIAW